MSSAVAREIAMKLAFASLFGTKDTYLDILEKSEITEKPTAHDFRYADEILTGLETKSDILDSYIEKYSTNWSIKRISKVDLCILRIAVYEIFYMDNVPVRVSISEAVKLAKLFGGKDSYKFVNGTLGIIAAGVENGEVNRNFPAVLDEPEVDSEPTDETSTTDSDE